MDDSHYNEISVTLTRRQIKHVLREAADEGGIAGALSSLKDRSRLLKAHRSISNPRAQVSRSLLLGLMIFACFPRDGGALGVKEIANLIESSPATSHRYIKTLEIAGLLEQEPKTRKYRLVSTQ